jgi:Tat protein secretion system quality control protein TatD with DNase activity
MHVVEVFNKLCTLRTETEQEVAKALLENVKRVFGV